MQTFKTILSVLAAMLGAKFIVVHWHWAWIPGMAAGLIFLFWYFIKRAEKRELVALNKRIDNIYIIVETEAGRLDMPTNYQDLVIHTTKKKLYRTIDETVKRLNRSGNKHGVSVKLIIYQDGMNINETPEEYRCRVLEEIRSDRSEQHQKVKERDPAYYLQAHHGAQKNKKKFTGKELNGSSFEWDNK